MAKRTIDDECMLCHAPGEDKRTLLISCGYELSEIVPELVIVFGGYSLRLCKCCRGALLRHLSTWRDERVARRGLLLDHDGYEEEE